MLRWPWSRRRPERRAVVAPGEDRFAWAVLDETGALACGVEVRGDDPPAEFQRRLRALALPPRGGVAVLPLADSQLFQIEAPPVKPDELKAAARWRIKDQVDGPVDALALDVMFVGGSAPRPNRHLFVAAAREATVQAQVGRARAAGVEVAAVDVAECAQRNLQTRVAAAGGLADRATAALVRHGEQALLTICAGGELCDARRLAWEPLEPAPAPRPVVAAATEVALDSADFVDYGAEPDDFFEATAAAKTPRLVVELQRSFDLWDRSWPDLPLAALWVQAGEASGELATLLAVALGQRVGVLDAAEALPGLAARPAAERAALLPILGALWRDETRTP